MAGDPRAPSRSTEAIVDLGAIARNYRLLHGRVGEKVAVIPVLKADAYGHGAAGRWPEGSPPKGRTALPSATRGRASDCGEPGLPGEILLLNFCEAKDLPLCRGYGLTPTLYDMEQARGFAQASAGAWRRRSRAAQARHRPRAPRVPARAAPDLAELLRAAPGLRIEGGLLASRLRREASRPPRPRRQIRVFRDAARPRWRPRAFRTGLVHLANSAGVLAHPDSHFDAVRPGIALYGVPPWDSEEGEGGSSRP